MIIGQLLFNFFRESTTMAMESVLKNAPLLRKVYIPKYIFPMEKCCFALVNCAFSFIALVIVFVITWTPVTWATAWMAIYPLIMLFFFSFGIGLLLSAMYVFVRDIMHIWEVFCTLLTYASAIFYDPETLSGIMQQLIHINPMYWYITRRYLRVITVCFLCAAASMGDRDLCVQKEPGQVCPVYVRGPLWTNSRSSRLNTSRCGSTWPKKSTRALKEYFVALLHGGVRFDEFFALSDVSLDIMPGDFYGLIGLNGSVQIDAAQDYFRRVQAERGQGDVCAAPSPR